MAGKCVEFAPLNQRAWVSQERQLSRRLLHFTSTQIFWECYENVACETYPEYLPDWAQPSWLQDATRLKHRLYELTHRGENDPSEPLLPYNLSKVLDYETYYAWGVYRYQFSGCALTRDTDKLVAIQGIASQVGQATGDKFIAGIWRSWVVEELCWFKDRVLRITATGFIIGHSGAGTVSLGARPSEGSPSHVTDSYAKDYR
ncbi:unnamed protein product [Alternaria alternata]